MNTLQRLNLWALALAVSLISLCAAEDSGSGTTAAVTWASLMIPAATPLLIAAVKALVPRIPPVLLPIAAPVIGAALQIVLNYAGMTDSGTLTGIILGAAGVGLREAVDQVKKLGGPINGKSAFAFLLLAPLCLVSNGCAARMGAHLKDISTSTEVTKNGSTNTTTRAITTDLSGSAWFSSKQNIAQFKALQTDKTQSIGGQGVGQQGATNAIRALELIRDITENVNKP